VRIFECWGYSADEGDLWGAVFDQAGDYFATFEVHENIFVYVGGLGA